MKRSHAMVVLVVNNASHSAHALLLHTASAPFFSILCFLCVLWCVLRDDFHTTDIPPTHILARLSSAVFMFPHASVLCCATSCTGTGNKVLGEQCAGLHQSIHHHRRRRHHHRTHGVARSEP